MTCKRLSRKAVATSACISHIVLTTALLLIAHSRHCRDALPGWSFILARTSYAFSSSIAFSAFVSVTTPTIAAAVAQYIVHASNHYWTSQMPVIRMS